MRRVLERLPALSRQVCAGLLTAWLGASVALAQGGVGDEFQESRPFSLPDKQSARALYDMARAHVNAGRFTEAVSAIERLIEEHSGSVIALPLGDETPPPSEQQVYRGAADAARELFARLSPEARRAYADRYQAKARELLLRASAALDTTALAGLARRYPLTDTAREAWWTLGDIEAEAGNLEAARAAWRRAAQAQAQAGGADRLDLRARWNPGDGALRAARSSSLSILSEAMDGLEVPSSDSHHWEEPLSLNEPGPLTVSRQDNFNSFPIVAGDCVLISNSLTLTAVDGLTGRKRWRSEEHPGWASVRAGAFVARDRKPVLFTDFFRGLDREGLMLAPACGAGIAVAALQVPFTRDSNAAFQNSIPITTVIPDRRLYAFDLETGAELWNHAPPPMWDCDSGDFTQRMRVAGPPVIAGARVLVPMWRPQGRISYHVACYELATGDYLWSTQVASGQRPLNMFGRLEREFCAPPLVVAGEKVIALTQLGTVAALDLFSGEILWQTIYDQIPLPQADGMSAGSRPYEWRNAPPAVEGGVIVATPLDSRDLIGIDLEHGAVLWSLPASYVANRSRTRLSGPWCLLGVRDDTIYLGGRFVLALQSAHRLLSERPKEVTSSESIFGDGYANPYWLPRPILTERHVIVPTSDGRIALDRENLKREDLGFSGSWGERRNAGFGNLAVGDGAMFSLSSAELCGVLDWRSMELRIEAEFARHPDDGALAARLGEFLSERAASERAESKLQAALEHLRRAEQVLSAPAAAGLEAARTALFHSLRLQAKVLVSNAQASLSLERLERAAAFAPDAPRRALVLAEIARAARELAREQRFHLALAQLERECGHLEFPSEPGAPLDEASSVLRWVIEQRISDAASRADSSREFAALVDLLARCGDGPLSESASVSEEEGETPARRIERRLAAGARARAAWQPFEDKARAALAAANESGDGLALERVARLFPHTSAARDARDARLRLAIDARDAPTAVRTALEELPEDWSAENSTPREAQLVWLAAQALQHDGNPLYARSLLQRLGRFQPRTAADERDPSVSFESLAAALEPAAEAGPAAAAEARFDTPSRELPSGQRGEFVLLGKLDLVHGSVMIVASRERFDAISADGTRLWTRPVEGATAPQAWLANSLLVPGAAAPDADAHAFSGRVLLSLRRGVLALDAASGEELWSWEQPGGSGDSPLAHDGGVVTRYTHVANGPPVLVGLDVARGTELWRHECRPENWPQPVVGSGLVVLLPKLPQARNAEVLEIATGTLLRSLDVGHPAATEDRRGAWIEHGRLILPRFGRARAPQDVLVGYDLESGARAWRVPGDGARILDSIVRCGSETYLVYLVSGSGSGNGGLVELDTRIGAVREIPGVSIGPDDLPIGLRSGVVTRIDEPYLFLRSPAPGGKETLVRSVHLPYGQRWTWRLKMAQADLYAQSLPLPAVSSRLVILVYTEEARGNSGRSQTRTHMVSIVRDSGESRELKLLHPDLGPSEALEMATLENLLFVCGKSRLMVLAGSDTEEQR